MPELQGAEYVTTGTIPYNIKNGRMYYCNLEQIGLIENVDGNFKQSKYDLSACRQLKRTHKPKSIFKLKI